MSGRRALALLMAGMLALTGCGGTPKKDTFYRLPEVAGSGTIKVDDGPLLYIPPLEADGLHGERALVYAHDDGTTLEQYTYHYWVDSPRVLLQQALAGKLRETHRVVTSASADARYILRGRILRFERQGNDTRASADVALEFELVAADSDSVEFARAYTRSVALTDDAMGTSAGALGEAAQDVLANLVSDLETYWGR